MTNGLNMNNNKNIISSIGRRKTSIAKIFLENGDGNIIVNQKPYEIYFSNLSTDREIIKKPLLLLNIINSVNITAFVKGGGIFSQIEAISLAISKSLCKLNNNYRLLLNRYSFLKSDSRMKERRKYGLKKARKGSQYSKR